MKLLFITGLIVMIGTCWSDTQTHSKALKRCKRQMAGCPGLRSGTGRCTGCHNGSGGYMGPNGCQGCSFGNTERQRSSPGARAWNARASASSAVQIPSPSGARTWHARTSAYNSVQIQSAPAIRRRQMSPLNFNSVRIQSAPVQGRWHSSPSSNLIRSNSAPVERSWHTRASTSPDVNGYFTGKSILNGGFTGNSDPSNSHFNQELSQSKSSNHLTSDPVPPQPTYSSSDHFDPAPHYSATYSGGILKSNSIYDSRAEQALINEREKSSQIYNSDIQEPETPQGLDQGSAPLVTVDELMAELNKTYGGIIQQNPNSTETYSIQSSKGVTEAVTFPSQNGANKMSQNSSTAVVPPPYIFNPIPIVPKGDKADPSKSPGAYLNQYQSVPLASSSGEGLSEEDLSEEDSSEEDSSKENSSSGNNETANLAERLRIKLKEIEDLNEELLRTKLEADAMLEKLYINTGNNVLY